MTVIHAASSAQQAHLNNSLSQRLLTTNLEPVALCSLLRFQVFGLRGLGAHLWELESIALAALESLPNAHLVPIRPRQRTNPRLHIPSQLQCHICPVAQLARDIRDLVFRLLVLEMQFADRVRRDDLLFGSSAFPRGLLGELGLGIGVDEVVLVPGRGRGCDDCVPDDGFRGGFGGAGGGVDGF